MFCTTKEVGAWPSRLLPIFHAGARRYRFPAQRPCGSAALPLLRSTSMQERRATASSLNKHAGAQRYRFYTKRACGSTALPLPLSTSMRERGPPVFSLNEHVRAKRYRFLAQQACESTALTASTLNEHAAARAPPPRAFTAALPCLHRAPPVSSRRALVLSSWHPPCLHSNPRVFTARPP